MLGYGSADIWVITPQRGGAYEERDRVTVTWLPGNNSRGVVHVYAHQSSANLRMEPLISL